MDEAMMILRKLSALLCLYTLTAFSTVAAQSELEAFNQGFQVNPARPAEFIYQSYGDQELISIRVLGSISKAGLYHIPKDMQLTTLLSLAGGTTENADLESVFISNEKRSESRAQRFNLEDALENGHVDLYQLQSNDVVYIKEKRPLISNDAWKAISVISVLLTSALTVLAIEDRL